MNYIILSYSNGGRMYLTKDDLINFSKSKFDARIFNSKTECKIFLSDRFLSLSDRIHKLNLQKGIFITKINEAGEIAWEEKFL